MWSVMCCMLIVGLVGAQELEPDTLEHCKIALEELRADVQNATALLSIENSELQFMVETLEAQLQQTLRVHQEQLEIAARENQLALANCNLRSIEDENLRLKLENEVLKKELLRLKTAEDGLRAARRDFPDLRGEVLANTAGYLQQPLPEVVHVPVPEWTRPDGETRLALQVGPTETRSDPQVGDGETTTTPQPDEEIAGSVERARGALREQVNQLLVPTPPRAAPTRSPKKKPLKDSLEMINLEGHNYYFSGESLKLSWSKALQFCRSRGMQLVSIEDAAENDRIKQHLTSNNYDYGSYNGLWLGGMNEPHHDLQLVWSGTGRPVVFTDWGGSPPDSLSGTMNCLVMWGSREDNGDAVLQWCLLGCTSERKFICEQ